MSIRIQNKETGEIIDLSMGEISQNDSGGLIELKQFADSAETTDRCGSLAELCEKWEDYKLKRLNLYEVSDILDAIRIGVVRVPEITIVNKMLRILGYKGKFDIDEKGNPAFIPEEKAK